MTMSDCVCGFCEICRPDSPELTTLRAKIADLERDRDKYKKMNEARKISMVSLRKDRDRLDWLENEDLSFDVAWKLNGDFVLEWCLPDGREGHSVGKNIRAAIDSAINETGG
jgi:hypothetical protein